MAPTISQEVDENCSPARDGQSAVGEAVIGAEMCQRRHQTLIYIERGKLVKFLKKIRYAPTYLRQQWESF